MTPSTTSDFFLLARNRMDIFDFVRALNDGDEGAWIALACILGCVAFFAIYKKVTGKSFVKSKAERRAACNRRKHVIWEYRSDD